MLYLIISRTRAGLEPADMERLAELAKAFYASVPEGLTLKENWTEEGGGRTVAMVETDDARLVEQIQAPFKPYVDMDVIPLVSIPGWRDAS
jgi:hypothetical protein